MAHHAFVRSFRNLAPQRASFCLRFTLLSGFCVPRIEWHTSADHARAAATDPAAAADVRAADFSA